MEGPGLNRGQFVTGPDSVATRIHPDRRLPRIRDQHLRGFDSFQFKGDFLKEQLGGGELAGGDVHVGQSRPSFVLRHGDQVVIRLLGEEGRFEHGARGNDPDHAPVHQALGGCRVGELFADGDFVALLDQPGEVVIQRMDRHSG